jgi:hypothetical protein
MIDTSLIGTGFDVEVQLGGPWFATALGGLIDSGSVQLPPQVPPGTPITVLAARVLGSDPDHDLEIDLVVGGIPITALADLALSPDGTTLNVTTDQDISVTVPFDVLHEIDGPPTLTKVGGGADTDAAMVLLANLDIKAADQAADPDDPVNRGDASLVTSFLPVGKHLAIGVGRDTFPRLANDVWHDQLTEDDGSHPLPDAENEIGHWQSTSMECQNGRIRLRLDGEVPIDWWPDADVDITIDLKPRIEDGVLVFEFEVDSDVDTGVLGDIFAFLGGGLVGLIIGFLLGGALIGAGIVAVLAVVVLEVGEAIVEGEVNRQVRAKLDEEVVSALGCSNGVIVNAVSEEGGGLALGVLDSIPLAIPIARDNPDPLHDRYVLARTIYEEVVVNTNGFAAAGLSTITERFQPLAVTMVDRARDPDEDGDLATLTYQIAQSQETLPLDEVLERVGEGELLQNPIRLQRLTGDITTTLLDGTLASVCLRPQAIRRAKTVITDVRFTTGLELRVSEAVTLQDAGVIHLEGLQLIRPSNGNPYFRSPPNDSTADNFESLPGF